VAANDSAAKAAPPAAASAAVMPPPPPLMQRPPPGFPPAAGAIAGLSELLDATGLQAVQGQAARWLRDQGGVDNVKTLKAAGEAACEEFVEALGLPRLPKLALLNKLSEL
jgi:hypothetical protein